METNSYRLAPEVLNRHLATYRDGLLQDTIPFWTSHAIDRQFGGYMTSVDRHGTTIDTDKSVWHQGRFAWMLGELYNNVEQRHDWLEHARCGIAFMDEHCFDPSDGRMWFLVTREGTPLRKRRYAFTESFAAIAYGELAQATGSQQYAEKAEACLQRFVSHTPAPKFTATRPSKGLGVPMITIGTAQELRQSIGLASADQLIDEAVATIWRDHNHDQLDCVLETVGLEGEFLDSFDGRLLNPGHAFEAVWFILREAAHRGNDAAFIEIGTRMLDRAWQWGWDDQFGGIIYFRDVKNRPPQEYWHDMKFWWPQNEAIIATLFAYVLTGNEKYANMYEQIHGWTYENFPDPNFGEWFGYLHRDGRLSHTAKGNQWKGPFHLPRMQLVCWKLLENFLCSRSETSLT